jgi:hypothetical protein
VNAPLYHATNIDDLGSIACEGMRAGSYWASDKHVHDYYCSTVRDEGNEDVSLTVELSELEPVWLQPDWNGIDEPLCFTLGMDEDEIRELWDGSSQDWRASLEIIGTLRYDAVIPPDKIYYEGERLTDWLARQIAPLYAPDAH